MSKSIFNLSKPPKLPIQLFITTTLFGWILVFFVGFLFTPAKVLAVKEKLEIYSATEEEREETRPLPKQPTPQENTTPVESLHTNQNQNLKEKPKPHKNQTPQNKTAKNNIKIYFDFVPPKQKEAIISRLKFIEQLIREQGRAYDYRSLTTTELEEIITTLQKLPLPPPPNQ